MRRRRDVEPENPFLTTSSSASKTKKKPVPKPAPRSRPEAGNKIDAAAVRRKMAAQLDEDAKKEEMIENITPEVQEDKVPEKEKVVVEEKKDISEKTLAAGALLFGVEQISDHNAEKLSDKIKDDLFEKKNAEKVVPVRRRKTKKGGGRQPKVSKFDRRKYLEYKVDMRNMLDEYDIEDEHRSNILGQVWAKGERRGVDDAIDFVNEKAALGIVPDEMVEKLKGLMKKYSKKR